MIEYIDRKKFRENLEVDCYGRTDIVKVAIALEKAKVDIAEDVKTGHWVIHSSGHGSNATNWAECSECHVCGNPLWKVCPVCEAMMEKHSAINIKEVAEIDFDYTAEDDNA